MLTIHQVESPEEVAAAGGLLREYTEGVVSLLPRGEHGSMFRALHEELATLPGIYAPPSGRLLLASMDGDPAGCVCLKPHDAALCEMKRLYVRPALRGHDIGRALVLRLLDEARTAGYRRIFLDSHVDMKPAHALYQSLGFRPMDAPERLPAWLRPLLIFMERDLTPE